MFLSFQKITTATASRRSQILVNSDEIMYMEVDSVYDKTDNVYYDATRVELIYNTFHTPSTFTDIASVSAMVDIRNGVGEGFQWENDPGVVDFTYPVTTLPLLRCNQIANSSRTTLNDYIFNPKFLIYAETVTFNDAINKTVEPALLIVLKDTHPKRILTDLVYDDLVNLLSASIVPVL